MKKILAILMGFLLLGATALVARQQGARAQVRQELETLSTPSLQLAATEWLKITPLYEQVSVNNDFIIGHGVSYLIETDGFNVLLDAGFHPEADDAQQPFERNMQQMGVSWGQIDAIMISHPHPDHIGGVSAWQDDTLALGNAPAGLPIFVPEVRDYPGVTIAAQPALLAPSIGTTGAIPFSQDFPVSLKGAIAYEHALVIHLADRGLVLVTGCGHPTIEFLITRAEAIYNLPVIGVVGGLHYQDAGQEELTPHIRFLQSRDLELIALSPHDSEARVLTAFEAAFPHSYHYIRVGETIQFP